MVELLAPAVVELFGGTELLGAEILVVRNADFGGGELVEAGGNHVAEELDGVVGMLGELGDIEEDSVKAVRRAHQPARPTAQGIVDTVENVR